MTTDFIATQHPRIDNGTFTAKEQSSPEFDKLFTSELFNDQAPHQLEVDDLVIISHAEGDFDAAELGVEGIELWRDDEGLHAEAYSDLDFLNLEGPHKGDASKHADWLEANRDAISAAVTAAYPAIALGSSDRNGGDWETQTLMISLHPDLGSSIPDTTSGLVELARENSAVQTFTHDATNDEFFKKVAYQMRLADLNTELAAAK
jgi:hypothetical protein